MLGSRIALAGPLRLALAALLCCAACTPPEPPASEVPSVPVPGPTSLEVEHMNERLLGYLTGLALLSLFAYGNLPEQNRSRSR
jgi:hypothetical protein